MALSREILIRTLIHDRARIIAYLRLLTREADIAEDVFQEASLRALEHLDSIEDEAHLNRWLRVVGRNLCFDAMKKRRCSPVAINTDLVEKIGEEWVSASESAQANAMPLLRQCIECLTPYGKRLIHQRYTCGLTGESLAKSLGRRNANTVNVALSRVHRQLYECVRTKLRRESEGAS